MKQLRLFTLALASTSLFLSACVRDEQDPKSSLKVGGGPKKTGIAEGEVQPGKSLVTKAVCVVEPVGGQGKVRGVIWFTQKGKTVEVTGEITGLTPGKHGFHVHEFGDLTDDKGLNTGSHFNPEGKKHGGHDAEDRHVGDLGNVDADENGKATIKLTDTLLSLHGPHSILGRAIIVHAKADDLKTQPTGDAGGRIGAGVIGIAKDGEKKMEK